LVLAYNHSVSDVLSAMKAALALLRFAEACFVRAKLYLGYLP
jgi:hypothetical protein